MSILVSAVGAWFINLLSLIPKLVYFICMSFVTVLDVFQFALRKISGLDAYYISGSTEPQTGDIALAFIRGVFEPNSKFPALKNAFWALIVLGVILLFLSTFIATIRAEYTTSDGNRYTVIANAVKGLFMFFIVPISVIFGLMISNVLLVAFDQATTGKSVYEDNVLLSDNTAKTRLAKNSYNGVDTYSNYDIFGGAIPSSNTPLSGLVFKVSAFSANRVRKMEEYNGKILYEYINTNQVSNFGIFTADNSEALALKIDEAFANNVVLSHDINRELHLGVLGDIAGVGAFTMDEGTTIVNFSKFNVSLVWMFYDLWLFNYIVAFAFIFALMKVMVNIVIGLMKRIIEIVALFLVSPPIVGLMPLDNGTTLNKWRQAFISKSLAVYGTIVGFNIFFLIMPYLQQIKFFPDSIGFWFINTLLSTLFIILALTVVESFIALISKIIGAEDVNKAGGELVGKVQDEAKKAGMILAAGAGVGVKALGMAGKGIGGAVGGVGNIIGKAATGNKDFNMGGAVKNAFSRGVGNMGLGKKGRESLKNKHDASWNEKGKGDAYAKYVAENKDFKNEVLNAYGNRTDKNMSFNDWQETDEAAISKNKIQEDLIKNKTLSDLDGFGNTAQGKKAYNNSLRSSLTQSGSARLEKGFQPVGKFLKNTKKFARASGRTVLGSVSPVLSPILGRANTLVGNMVEEFKDATIRGGKGAFPAMTKSFLLDDAKSIKKSENEKRIAKEEGLISKARNGSNKP